MRVKGWVVWCAVVAALSGCAGANRLVDAFGVERIWMALMATGAGLFAIGLVLAGGKSGSWLLPAVAQVKQAKFAPMAVTEGVAAPAPLWDGRQFHQAASTVAPAGSRLAHVSTHNRQIAAPATEPPATLALAIPDAPSFDALRREGMFQGEKMVVGYHDGAPVWASWEKDIRGALIAGTQGSGKTSTMRFLVASLTYRALTCQRPTKYLLGDIHGLAGEESMVATLAALERSFLAEPAVSPDAVLKAAARATAEMDARLSGGENTYQILLVIDEWNQTLAALGHRGKGEDELLASYVEGIAMAGRKAGVYVLLAGQAWTGRRAGGTELRASVPSSYVHNFPRESARMIPNISGDDAARCESLRPGQAMLSMASGATPLVVSIPFAGPADVAAMAGELAQFQTARALFPKPGTPGPARALAGSTGVPLSLANNGQDAGGTGPELAGTGAFDMDTLARIYVMMRQGRGGTAMMEALGWLKPGQAGRAKVDASTRLAAAQAAMLAADRAQVEAAADALRAIAESAVA